MRRTFRWVGIDYAEVFDPARQELNFFLHYGPDDSQLHGRTRLDMTQWHHFAVEWTPDHIIGFVDGTPFFHTNRREPCRLAPCTRRFSWIGSPMTGRVKAP
jgi:hypothetical protein